MSPLIGSPPNRAQIAKKTHAETETEDISPLNGCLGLFGLSRCDGGFAQVREGRCGAFSLTEEGWSQFSNFSHSHLDAWIERFCLVLEHVFPDLFDLLVCLFVCLFDWLIDWLIDSCFVVVVVMFCGFHFLLKVMGFSVCSFILFLWVYYTSLIAWSWLVCFECLTVCFGGISSIVYLFTFLTWLWFMVFLFPALCVMFTVILQIRRPSLQQLLHSIL